MDVWAFRVRKQRCWFVSQVLRGQKVGLEEVEDGLWSVYFGPVLLGRYDERQQRLHTSCELSALDLD